MIMTCLVAFHFFLGHICRWKALSRAFSRTSFFGWVLWESRKFLYINTKMVSKFYLFFVFKIRPWHMKIRIPFRYLIFTIGCYHWDDTNTCTHKILSHSPGRLLFFCIGDFVAKFNIRFPYQWIPCTDRIACNHKKVWQSLFLWQRYLLNRF